ncbi:ATP-dependent helicase [Lacipirellula limnantheis]|uniref:DNA 3'-5' helicase n=1 Tax=Lacipirellula limnantheis TaxID=2528024 RepID=A0A517TX85_9BACT|nr:UvrD-helicase domain-containing protein [Lacipirellula limnantheis]QDT72988.1 ATP-dependent DNA helicase PcrA [Lacipirellula limnantheis]
MAHGLNPSQHAAVETLSGPLLVLAGAGTGKTRVVTHRIANLIKHRIKPDRILAVTFTRKAAGEMQERAMALLSAGGKGKGKAKKPTVRPQISTFHALCVQVLRRHIAKLGYPPQFAICDRGDQESLARAALREIRVPEDSLRPGDLLAIISNWKNRSLRPAQAASVAASDREHLAAAGYRRYQSSLKARGMVDFDDLLLCTEELFVNQPAIRREEAGRFDHVLVDEYQDTNGSQYRIVKALAMGHRNLCVVGDDDQSIYGWRGAEVEHILRFKEDWPEAKVVRLEENYRSAGAILHYANTLIAFNKHRHDKILRPARGAGQRPVIMQLPDETQEAERIVGDIQMQLTQPGVKANDFAILCRTNEQPRAFETELRRLRLPYILVGGQSFFDRKEVRDLLAYLKTVADPTDETSLLRIINTPPRGIGNATVKQLLAEAVNRGEPIWNVLREAAGNGGAAAAAIGKFITTIRELREIADRGAPIDKLIDAVVDRVQYRRELERLYPDPMEREARTASIEELINAGAAYDKGKKSKKKDEEEPTLLRNFLDDVALGGTDQRDEKEDQLQRNAIALMTLHSAKGLEFPYVYMVGMEEGILPHKRTLEMPDESQIDEERRLCYVGVTRAQEKLTLSFALTRRKWGKPRETVPSRFLYEMTGQAENAAKARRAGVASHAAPRKHPASKGAKGAASGKGPHTKSPRR